MMRLNTTKDAIKNAPGFKYDRQSTTWVPDNRANNEKRSGRQSKKRLGEKNGDYRGPEAVAVSDQDRRGVPMPRAVLLGDLVVKGSKRE
ncbi:MAG: hypothetical protein WAV38_30945 [Xanthobacteraceae bacterium]